MDPAAPLPNSSDLYAALNVEPTEHAGGHRYIHVIGTSVFVDTELADVSWERHVIGIVEGDAWWAVDVPADVEDPSYGSALDLFSYLSLIHISEPTRLLSISYAVFCLKKKK